MDRQCVRVVAHEDDVVEGPEDFTLTLNSTDGVDLDPDTATVTIEESMCKSCDPCHIIIASVI